jgi:hypothetical protein
MTVPRISRRGVRWVIAQFPRLQTAGQVKVLICIAAYCDSSGCCVESRSRLAETAGFSVRHITRVRTALARLGAIEIIESERGQGRVYVQCQAIGWGAS